MYNINSDNTKLCSKDKPNQYIVVLISFIRGDPQFRILKNKHGNKKNSMLVRPLLSSPFVVSIYQIVDITNHIMMVSIIRQKIDKHFICPIDILPLHTTTTALIFYK